MDAIEKRARELVEMAASAEHYGIDYYEERMIRESDVLAVIIAALTPPEGYVLVPKVLTEDMLNVIYTAESDMTDADMQALWTDVIAARPEVP